MEKKEVCISMTAREFEALSNFAKNQNELSNRVWTKIVEEALKAGLIRIVEPSQRPVSKAKKPIRMRDEERVELLKELVPADGPIEEDYRWILKAKLGSSAIHTG